MSKKNKKGTPTFKLTAKTEDESAQVLELQMKKKILQSKYENIKNQTESSVIKLTESRNRLMDIMHVKDNEIGKYNSVKSDFIHQTLLITKNYKNKLDILQQTHKEKAEEIEALKAKLEKMKNEFNLEYEKKSKMQQTIKNNMEELTKSFSEHLGDIQNNLKEQIEKITDKWEHNLSDHIKRFEASVNKYDINK